MDELIEDMARAMCEADGYDADEAVIGGQAQAFENYGPRWRAAQGGLLGGTDYVTLARAALAAIHARGDRVVPGVANVTNPMRSAVVAGYENSKTYDGFPTVAAWDFFALGYPAMLSASPYAPEETK